MAFHFQMWIEEKRNHGVCPSVRDYYSISLPGCPLVGLGQGWTLLLGCLLWDGNVNKMILQTYPHQYITTWLRIKLSSSAMNTVLTVQCQNCTCSHFVTNTCLPAVAKMLLLSLINHKVSRWYAMISVRLRVSELTITTSEQIYTTFGVVPFNIN